MKVDRYGNLLIQCLAASLSTCVLC